MWLETEGLYIDNENTPESSYYLPEEYWDLELALMCYIDQCDTLYLDYKDALIKLLEDNKEHYIAVGIIQEIEGTLYRGGDPLGGLSWSYSDITAARFGAVCSIQGPVYALVIPEEMGLGEEEVLILPSDLKGIEIHTC